MQYSDDMCKVRGVARYEGRFLALVMVLVGATGMILVTLPLWLADRLGAPWLGLVGAASGVLATMATGAWLVARALPRILDLVHDFRSAAEPRRVPWQADTRYAILEKEFMEKVSHWGEPCLDTSAFAYSLAAECGASDLLDSLCSRRVSIKERLLAFYDESSGGFRQYPQGRAGVYATHHALAMAKQLVIRDAGPERLRGRPLGWHSATTYIDEARLGRAVEFVLAAQDPNTGGFLNRPRRQMAQHRPCEPNITSTHSAVTFLWEVGRLDDSVAEGVFRFLARTCYDEGMGGFADQPGGLALGCATYLALRLLERQLGPAGKQWLRSHASSLRSFFRSLWTSGLRAEHGRGVEWGAFVPFRGSQHPSLTQTAYSCTALLDMLSDTEFFDEAKVEKVLSYLRLCRSDPYAGFKFHFGASYAPNVFATRNVLRTVRLLERHAGRVGVQNARQLGTYADQHAESACAFLRALMASSQGDGETPTRLVTGGYAYTSPTFAAFLQRLAWPVGRLGALKMEAFS